MPDTELKYSIIATDGAIFTILDGALNILLIPVHIVPFFERMQGLPGGLIAPDETAEDSVFRHIRNKTGLNVSWVEQLHTFSAIKRDPRGRVVSVAYTALIPEAEAKRSVLREGVAWVKVNRLPKLAYDHNEIAKKALENLREKLWYTKLAQYLLPPKFTLSEMQAVFDVVLHTSSDKRNFRKKVLNLDMIKKVRGKKREGAHRPAELYAFKG